jgi:hypothetical protein
MHRCRGQEIIQNVECNGEPASHRLKGATGHMASGPPTSDDWEDNLCYCDNMTTITQIKKFGELLHGDGDATQDNIQHTFSHSSTQRMQSSGDDGTVGMVDRHIIFPTPRVDMGSPPHRPICHSNECQSSQIHLMETGGNRLGPGRIQKLLVQHEQGL